MPQETNLNVSPYFDDFNEDKNFKRVLFKPGSPVQARELTQLQTILQNQMEKFGQHFFKEGSMVIPGGIGYDAKYYAVELEDTFLGIPISEYLDKLVGKTIKGETSGVEAEVVNYILSTTSDRGHNTLYIKYSKAGDDFTTVEFVDGENFIVPDSDIEYGNSRIIATNPFATAIPLNATSIGSACTIADGVYFIRGYFLNITKQTIIIDQYSNSPSGRIGLYLDENIVTAFSDSTLFDNAAGFSNFAAPGADRFQITTTLIRKDLDDISDANFIELLRLNQGAKEKMVEKTDYNILSDEFARRTYDESGNYYVKPFALNVRESLNDRQGNNGVYFDNQKTQQGNTPSSDTMIYQLEPGKAYVRGYEVTRTGNTFLDVEKPREVRELKKQSFVFDKTSSVMLNRVYGAPNTTLGTNATVSLRDQRTGSTHANAAGSEIGVARVYDFKLEAERYSDASTKYELFLWDIQTYTSLTLSSSLTAIEGSLIEGANTGARGYLKSAASGASISLTSTNGTFITNEAIIVNGVKSNQTIATVTEYSFDDVKSVYQSYTLDSTTYKFNADTDLSRFLFPAPRGTEFTINHTNGVVSVGGQRFSSGVKIGDIVRYQKTGESDPTYNRVTAVASTGATITIAALAADVTGVCQKELVAATGTSTRFVIVRPRLLNPSNTGLISDLPEPFISKVDLSASEILVRKNYTFTVSSNTATITLTEDNEYFEPFDEEKYNISFSDGSIYSLRSGNLSFNATYKTLTLKFAGISNTTKGVLVATIKKTIVKSQNKTLNRCNTITINKTQGVTVAQNGVTANSVYGNRVEDKEICLYVPDGVRVHAIFESSTAGDPSLPTVTLTNRSADLTDTIQGEVLIGNTSGAAARVVNSATATVDVVYVNDLEFIKDETVTFQSSGIDGLVSSTVDGDSDIVDNFQFDNGQRPELYDFARIIRKDDSSTPSKRLTVVFDNYTLDGEVGDFATVNSYSADNFEFDIPTFSGIPVSDFIDVRPRVSSTPVSTSISPFDYDNRTFAVGGVKPSIIVGDESMSLTYSHYLSRIDKIYLDKDGNFELKKGSSAPVENVVPPADPAGSFIVATISNNPYIRRAGSSKVLLARHKRYTMSDIARLENRLKNVEFYTQLSLLETDTSSLTIVDAKTGDNRFKSGFFVDNFRSHGAHAVGHPNFRASIDKARGELRPTHYTHGLDLLLGSEQVIGIGTNSDPNADLTQVSDLQSNALKRTGDLITLDYTSQTYIEQKFATRWENVNPFASITWVGGVELNPSSDVWLDEKRLKTNVVEVEGDYQKTLDNLKIDPNTGFSPADWGEWETVWSSTSSDTQHTGTSQTRFQQVGRERTSRGNGGELITSRSTITDTFEETITVDTGMSRSGIQFKVDARIDEQSLGDKLVSRETIPYMRSRNIEFVATRIQPGTRFYPFFDGQNVEQYITPKLIEISMDNGVFQVGEQVVGTSGDSIRNSSAPRISFRVAQPDHKFGSYNDPRITYAVNPYASTTGISSSYSATSSVLNMDTGSLQQKVLGAYFGRISKDMKLLGLTSGAEATVTDTRLITDEKGALIGSLFVPNPSHISAPEFTTGTKTFRLSSSITDSRSPLDKPSVCQANFRAEGTTDTVQEDIMMIRNAEISQRTVTDDKTTTSSSSRTYQTESFEDRVRFEEDDNDPLAQSFEVKETNGIFLESVDIWFKTKDVKVPVTLQIRTMRTGLPTQGIVSFGEVTLDPEFVNISETGVDESYTRFTFSSPVFLEGQSTDYAIVLLAQSVNYNVYISRMSEEDLRDVDLEESERRIVSQQPHLGSFFKSQNGATWTPSQYEDLKFVLNRCKFVSGPGILKLYNPELGVGEMERPILRRNPLLLKSNEITIKCGGNVTGINVGDLLSQSNNTNAQGKVTSLLGPLASNSLTHQTNSGIGLVNATYTSRPLTNITGNGSGGVATIVIASGTVNSVTVTTNGSGYTTGDVLGATVGDTGTGLRFTVGTISNVNSLTLHEVQGTFDTSNTLTKAGSAKANSTPSTVNISSSDKDGLHIKVFHRNHGMHATNNRVIISGAVGINTVTTLSEKYSNNATSAIKVASVSNLADFEGLTVSTTNPGYVQIGNEVIKYTGTNGSTTPEQLTGITRAIDNSVAATHDAATKVRKYQTAGISLRRINKTHLLSESDIVPDLDSYHIKIDVTASGNGVTRDGTSSSVPLKIDKTLSDGGELIRATQNIQFEAITPMVEFLTPVDTQLSGRVRTTTGTSANGTEVSFVDEGFSDVALNGINYFDSPRLIVSKINEQNNLTALPGSKSFTTELLLTSNDQFVSPIIDTDRFGVITTTNRIDSPITDYPNDSRVNSLFNDPTSAIYITKRVSLENPATSLQTRFAAFNHISNDIRVLYRILRADVPSNEEPFILFPGFSNLKDTTGDGYGDQLLAAENSNGTSDRKVPSSRTQGEFRDYQFTANDLPEFHGFQIKVVLTSSNQAIVPRLKDFRTIALA